LHQELDKVALLDAASGERRGARPLDITTSDKAPFQTNAIEAYLLMQTSDGSHFVFGGRQRRNREPHLGEAWLEEWFPNVFGDDVPALVVIESATGRELLRLANAGNQSLWLKLSDDASTLLTVDVFDDDRRLVRVWDVRPIRAWLWAGGVVVGMALGLFVLRRVWRQRAAHKSGENKEKNKGVGSL
jgi:hypothetical protein